MKCRGSVVNGSFGEWVALLVQWTWRCAWSGAIVERWGLAIERWSFRGGGFASCERWSWGCFGLGFLNGCGAHAFTMSVMGGVRESAFEGVKTILEGCD